MLDSLRSSEPGPSSDRRTVLILTVFAAIESCGLELDTSVARDTNLVGSHCELDLVVSIKQEETWFVECNV